MTDETTETELCECGYEDNSFACKIRHQSFNVSNLKRDREGGSSYSLVEQPKG